MEELETFINLILTTDELKRSMAVRMRLRGHLHREIMKILQGKLSSLFGMELLIIVVNNRRSI